RRAFPRGNNGDALHVEIQGVELQRLLVAVDPNQLKSCAAAHGPRREVELQIEGQVFGAKRAVPFVFSRAAALVQRAGRSTTTTQVLPLEVSHHRIGSIQVPAEQASLAIRSVGPGLGRPGAIGLTESADMCWDSASGLGYNAGVRVLHFGLAWAYAGPWGV